MSAPRDFYYQSLNHSVLLTPISATRSYDETCHHPWVYRTNGKGLLLAPLIIADPEEPGCIIPVSKELSVAVAVCGAESLLVQVILAQPKTLAALG